MTPILICAMIFIGLPFVVRTLQPVMLELDPEYEEAAASLGASRWQSSVHILGRCPSQLERRHRLEGSVQELRRPARWVVVELDRV